MEIKQKDNGNKGSFYAVEDGKRIGEMTYVWVDDSKFIIDHTGVPEEYANRGIGKSLLLEAVRFARKQEIKIIPLCPFASALFKKMPELADVLS